MGEEKVSLIDVLTLFEKEKHPRELTAEDALERMIIVLHRQGNRIERIEKVTRLMAKAIENLRVTTEMIAKNESEKGYKEFFTANYGKKRE